MPPKRIKMLQRFGHAGEHLREALLEALNYSDDWWKHVEIEFNFRHHDEWWRGLSDRRRASWLLGQLWNCTDIVPGDTRCEVRDWFPNCQEPFTYAALTRLLAVDLAERAAEGSR